MTTADRPPVSGEPPLARVVDMQLDERGLTVTVQCDDQEGYERLMRAWEQTERAIVLALGEERP